MYIIVIEKQKLQQEVIAKHFCIQENHENHKEALLLYSKTLRGTKQGWQAQECTKHGNITQHNTKKEQCSSGSKEIWHDVKHLILSHHHCHGWSSMTTSTHPGLYTPHTRQRQSFSMWVDSQTLETICNDKYFTNSSLQLAEQKHTVFLTTLDICVHCPENKKH